MDLYSPLIRCRELYTIIGSISVCVGEVQYEVHILPSDSEPQLNEDSRTVHFSEVCMYVLYVYLFLLRLTFLTKEFFAVKISILLLSPWIPILTKLTGVYKVPYNLIFLTKFLVPLPQLIFFLNIGENKG